MAAQQTADAAALANLKPLTLLSGDVPVGLAERSSVPLSRVNVIEGLSAIEPLQDFMSESSVDGGWATIFASADPPAALTSVVLRFTDPADAQALIDTIAGLTTADYPGATTLERAPSDKIEDKAQLMRSERPGANTLEYSWAQGRLVGQLVFRYPGEGGGPEDVAQLIQLARKQADLMRIYRQ